MASSLSVPAAVLWDLDGTLLETESLWLAAELEIAAEHGVRWAAADAEAMVAGDDGLAPKPDPAPYLRAAQLLGVPISATVVLEDSPSGIAAGVASGARVLGIESVLPVAPRTGLSVVASLEQVTVDDLVRVATGHVVLRRRVG